MARSGGSKFIKNRSLSLQEIFEEERISFIASPCHQRLLDTLEQNRPSNGWNISTAILMALGRLVHKPDSRSQLHQLVVFLEVVKYLQECTDSKVKIFAQEPRFEDAAIDFIESVGFVVLWEPEAEGLIREGGFTMAPFYGWDDTLLARERQLRPTLYIGLPHEHVKSNLHEKTPEKKQWLDDCGVEYNRFRLCPDDCAHATNWIYNLDRLEVYCSRTSEQARKEKKKEKRKERTNLRREQAGGEEKEKEKDDSPLMETQHATQGKERHPERKTEKVGSDDS